MAAFILSRRRSSERSREDDIMVRQPTQSKTDDNILFNPCGSSGGLPALQAMPSTGCFHNLVDWVLGSTMGQWAFLLFCGFCLIFCGTFAWRLTPGTVDFPSGTLYECLWMSYTLWADVGTQTGLTAEAPGICSLVVIVFSFLGFIYNLALLGLVVDVIRGQLAHWKRTKSRIAITGHVLILGWGDKTLYLLNELIAADANAAAAAASRKRTAPGRCSPCTCCAGSRLQIVIMANRSKLDMKQEVETYFQPRFGGSASRLKNIVYRKGDATDQAELLKVSAPLAKAILIMSDGQGGSDEHVMQTLLALAALHQESPLRGEVFAEMQHKFSLMVVNDIFPLAEGIIARHTVNRILVLRALVPSVGYTYMELVSFSRGSELYVRPLPKELDGMPFAASCRLFPDAVVCGISTKGQHSHVIPSGNYRFTRGDSLVMLSTSMKGAETVRQGNKNYEEPRGLQIDHKFDNLIMPDGQLKLGPSVSGPKVVLVLGFPSDFPDFLEILDSYLASNSEVHVLSERPESSRTEDLRRHFGDGMMDLDPGSVLKRIKVVHHFGSTQCNWAIKQMPLASADCAIILSESHSKNEPLIACDSRNLTSIITLRSLMPKDKSRKKCKVVTELTHPKSQQVVNGNSSIRRHGSFVYSTSLETAVFALASEEKAVYNILTNLLSTDGTKGHIVVVPCRDFVRGTEDLSFVDLHTRVFRTSGGILLGWRRTMSHYPMLNPPDKDKPVDWSENRADDLIVFCMAPVGVAASLQGQHPAHEDESLLAPCAPPGCLVGEANPIKKDSP